MVYFASPANNSSWEPSENVADCTRLLESFWKHVGMDNEDYPTGYEVSAEPEWIGASKFESA